MASIVVPLIVLCEFAPIGVPSMAPLLISTLVIASSEKSMAPAASNAPIFVAVNVSPLKVKSESSCNSPLPPAMTTLPLVKSPIAAVPADKLSIFAVPSMYKSFHSKVAEPKSNLLSSPGVIEPVISSEPVNLCVSLTVSPNCVEPLEKLEVI